MNKLNSLIEEINNEESVKRFKIIERIIDYDENIGKNFKNLLDLQKKMVQDETSESSSLELSRNKYFEAKKLLENNILIQEYLDLLEEINNDLQLIQKIIISEIDMDFE